MSVCPLVNGACIGKECLSFTEKPKISYTSAKSSRIPSMPIVTGSYYFCTALNIQL